jgi:tetratricopeptide (TPR) repeat protein
MEYLAGQIDASISSLQHALRLNPSLFVPMLFLGKAYIQIDKPKLALPYLNHAHALRPNDSEGLLALGKANAALKRQREAASFYAEAARIAPKSTEAWFGLGVASLDVIAADGRDLATTKSQSTWARSLYADELLAQGRPLEASDTYQTALASASPAEEATLARTLEGIQSHPDLFPLPPKSQEALRRLVAQLEAEHPKKAGGSVCPAPYHLGWAGATAPGLTALLHGAACDYWAGDFEQSAAQAGQAVRGAPQSGEALYWSIKANERVAVAALSRFEELAPQSAETYVLVGNLYRLQQDADNGLIEYKKALAINAHYPAALMGATAAYLSLGKLDEAASMDQAALADHPLDPQFNLLMAEILAGKHQFRDAKVYIAKSLDVPADLQPRVHILLGRADAEDGETEEAIRQFELALASDEDGSVHYQLSRLYRKAGNLAKAEKAQAEAKVLIEQRHANAAIAVREAIGRNP